jgi:hypothetical protein
MSAWSKQIKGTFGRMMDIDGSVSKVWWLKCVIIFELVTKSLKSDPRNANPNGKAGKSDARPGRLTDSLCATGKIITQHPLADIGVSTVGGHRGRVLQNFARGDGHVIVPQIFSRNSTKFGLLWIPKHIITELFYNLPCNIHAIHPRYCCFLDLFVHNAYNNLIKVDCTAMKVPWQGCFGFFDYFLLLCYVNSFWPPVLCNLKFSIKRLKFYS